jgi:serine/threonine protein kinase
MFSNSGPKPLAPLNLMSPSAYAWLTRIVGAIQVIEPMEGGHHRNWRCQTDAGLFVLRQPHASPLKGLDYQREAAILQAVNTAPWAIKAQLFGADEPWLLSHFVPGRAADSRLFSSPKLWSQFISMLNQLQALTAPLMAHTQLRDMQDYLHAALNGASVHPQGAQFAKHAALWLQQVPLYGSWSLNHHDLTPENLRITPDEQLVLLDWEYAAVSLKGWDIATLAEHFELSAAQQRTLQQLARLRPQQLQQWQHASRLLNLLWFWAQPEPENNHSLISQSQQWLSDSEKQLKLFTSLPLK